MENQKITDKMWASLHHALFAYKANKLCRFCDQPMKPKGVKKKPNEYDHAQGCPYSRRRNR